MTKAEAVAIFGEMKKAANELRNIYPTLEVYAEGTLKDLRRHDALDMSDRCRRALESAELVAQMAAAELPE